MAVSHFGSEEFILGSILWIRSICPCRQTGQRKRPWKEDSTERGESGFGGPGGDCWSSWRHKGSFYFLERLAKKP